MSLKRSFGRHYIDRVVVTTYAIGFQPSYQIEGRTFARHVLSTQADAKSASYTKTTISGGDVLKGFKDGLGGQGVHYRAELSYETADPTIDSQVVRCRSPSAKVFTSMTTPKFAAQGIKKGR